MPNLSLPKAPPAFTYLLVLVCFFASGFAALLYQTAWIRQFSIAFGTSEFAVASVLAAYMAGLAAGAAIAARFVGRINRPVLVYGILEGGIALAALGVPWFIKGANWVLLLTLGGQTAPPDAGGISLTAFYLFVTFIVLLIPTALMGATLPLLTRYAVREDSQVGPRIGLLYGINTTGAVFGVVLAGFVFLPLFGLWATVLIGVVANALVFLLAVALEKGPPATSLTDQGIPEPTETGQVGVERIGKYRNDWIYILIAASGATSFLYEVLWTRLLSHVLTGSIYAFSTMLASFLIGIALGGAVAGRFATSQQRAIWLFASTQFLIAVSAAVIYIWLASAPPLERGLTQNAVLAFLVITPSALFIGATFPFAVRIATSSADRSASVSARVYSWNTAGAIVGALAAAFVVIPALGFSGTIRLAVASNLALAVLAVLTMSRGKPRIAWLSAATALLFGVIFHPNEPMTLVASSAFDNDAIANERSRQIFYDVGRSSTVYVNQLDGRLYLKTNGLPEAQSNLTGAPPTRNTQKWLGAIPFTVRPNAESALIVGYGGGLATQGVPPGVQDIHVIELEPEVIAANQAMADLRQSDPLKDDRVKIIINDARGALNLSDRKYDVIISQPSHPWTPGASHLYSHQFMELARSSLTDDGVFLQWINATFIDESLLRSLSATISDQFEHVRLYQPDPMVLFFVASKSPFESLRAFQSKSDSDEAFGTHFDRLGIKSIEDLIAAIALDDTAIRTLARGATINTDDHNLMATRSRALADGLQTEDLEALLAPIDPLLVPNGALRPSATLSYDIGYLSRRLIETGFESRALDLAMSLDEPGAREFARAIGLRNHGRNAQANEALRKALSADPSNGQIRYALVQPHLAAYARNAMPPALIQEVDRLDPSARTVFQGWQHGARGEWSVLRTLEDRLAEAKPSDLWYPDATKLRLDWRVQLASRENRLDYAAQAIQISDQLLTTYETADIYALRAAAGLIANELSVFAESLRAIAVLTSNDILLAREGTFSVSARELAIARQRLSAMGEQARMIYETTEIAQLADVLVMVESSLEEIEAYQLRLN